jgi:hypothetical protein
LGIYGVAEGIDSEACEGNADHAEGKEEELRGESLEAAPTIPPGEGEESEDEFKMGGVGGLWSCVFQGRTVGGGDGLR